MTIMDVAGPIIEEERRKAEEAIQSREVAIRSREVAIRSREAERILGIRNMAELCFQFGQPMENTKATVIKKYPDSDMELINSIVSEIYEGN